MIVLKAMIATRNLEANSVFSLFYFRDIQYVLQNKKSLSPLVVAGMLIGRG